MISGAEAHRIGRALESVAAWAAEIIVVLNVDVVDATDQIAAKHGAKVFREPWKGHVAQKNSAAENAAQDWILGLDADEVISAELRQEIERLLADGSQAKGVAAFSFPRLSWYCGRCIRHVDLYPDRQTRLWRRGRATWGAVDPHGKLRGEGKGVKPQGHLKHYRTQNVNPQGAQT